MIIGSQEQTWGAVWLEQDPKAIREMGGSPWDSAMAESQQVKKK